MTHDVPGTEGSHLLARMSIKHTKQCCVFAVNAEVHRMCILHVVPPALAGGKTPPEPVITTSPRVLHMQMMTVHAGGGQGEGETCGRGVIDVAQGTKGVTLVQCTAPAVAVVLL